MSTSTPGVNPSEARRFCTARLSPKDKTVACSPEVRLDIETGSKDIILLVQVPERDFINDIMD
jgi:hypothetical protein